MIAALPATEPRILKKSITPNFFFPGSSKPGISLACKHSPDLQFNVMYGSPKTFVIRSFMLGSENLQSLSATLHEKSPGPAMVSEPLESLTGRLFPSARLPQTGSEQSSPPNPWRHSHLPENGLQVENCLHSKLGRLQLKHGGHLSSLSLDTSEYWSDDENRFELPIWGDESPFE
ncbi:hypothetical protein OGAPHI_003596 [Ogataea philodendri]|uniref:Uncharacterized protein n=1 Tax=Ogataea philodendri TaxID=1378263 RepID=A0A9P8P5N7_9ASCO|nr:uncharacterized protein OGAPHI_003596 [Ogataea philodendri]KAH3665412.1 hypothetical protein OGAPHI_003596 [Ogataea philodendri]